MKKMAYRVQVASIYLLGFFLDLVNMFIANIAYPQIGNQLQASVGQLAWISNSYILGLTVVIPLSSWLAKCIGSKRVFISSLILFILSTYFVGFSSSIEELIAWRFLQGLGGGLLIPIGQTITYELYKNNERAKLSSLVMIVALLAPALSPTIGGLLIENISWRWVFLISIPLALITLGLSIFWLKEDKLKIKFISIDLVGLISACSALSLILLGLTYIGDMKHLGLAITILVVGVLIMFLYVKKSLNKKTPLLNLQLIKNPFLKTAMIIYQFIPGIFTGINLIVMLYFQEELKVSPTHVGLLMIPWSIFSFIAITLTGRKFNTLGPRPLFICGSLLQGLGILLLAFVSIKSIVILSVIAFALMGFGGSLCSSTAQSSAFLQVSNNDLADASALWNINRQLSFCLGVTIISLLLNLLIYTNIGLITAYRLCFLIVSISVIIPIFFCFRIFNKNSTSTST